MFRRKLIRVASAILMILALTLPIASPASAVATVTAVSPTSGSSGGGTAITITGTDFQPGTCTAVEMTAVTTVTIGTTTPTAATSVVVVSDTSITAVTGARAAGAAQVVTVSQGSPPSACTGAGTTVTSAALYTYVNPTATSVGPPSGLAGITVSILGSNMQGTTDVRYVGPLPASTSTSDTGTPVVASNGLSVTSVVPASLAAGTYSVSLVNASGTFAQPVSFTVLAPAATVGPTPFPTIVGGQDVTVTVTSAAQNLFPCGLVVGPAPGFALTLAPAPGSPVANVTVVVVNITDVNSARAVVTDAFGVARFGGLTPGTYRITSADNTTDYTPDLNVPGVPVGGEMETEVEGGTGRAGHLIDTRIVNVTGAGNFAVPLICKTVPALAVITVPAGPAVPLFPPTESILFGQVVDWFTGLPIIGASILVNSNVGTETSPQAGTQLSSVLTDANGMWATAEMGAGPYIARLAPSLGLNCVVSGINTCSDAVQGLPGRVHDPNFLGTSQGAGVAGTMQGVIPMVYRDADITRLGGIRIETTMVRISNAGPIRTVACIDWHNSDANGTRIGTERDCLDLAAGAVGIFTNIGDLIPAGIMGMAEFFSIDQDGPTLGNPDPGQPGTVYGISDLHATVSYQVREAGNAIAGNNALSSEDLAQIGGEANTTIGIATVFKNYSGTTHRHSSVVQACNTTGVAVRQPVVFTFIGITDQRGATGATSGIHTLSADPGGCVSFNMNDITFLRDGTYAIRIISTGLAVPPLQRFLFPLPGTSAADSQRTVRPASFFASSITYNRTGAMANSLHAYQAGGGGSGSTGINLRFGKLYGALVFNDYNGWNSGLTVANFAGFGDGGSSNISMTFYDEASRVVGIISDRIGGESGRTFYLPLLPFTLPSGFKGMVIVEGTPAEFSNEASLVVYANHVNYPRNQNMAYVFTSDDQLRAPPANDTRPCIGTDPFTRGVQFLQKVQSCLWVSEAVRQAPGGIPNGPTTGIRVFNPTAGSAEVEVIYFDSAGFEWTDARTVFTIPAFSQATLFLGTERRLPEVWSGSALIRSSQIVVGIANVVNYGITGHDESRAFNLPNQSGRTQ